MEDFIPWLIDFMRSIDPVARTLIAGVAVLLETSVLIGLVVPGDTVVLVASIGITGPAQAAAMIVAVLVGALIGESIGFWLGRWIGPHIRSSWVGRRVGEKNWVRAERYLARRGGIAIFLSRFLPVLHSLVPLTVGMSHFSYRRFLAWTAPACLLWATAYVSITSLAAGSFDELADKVHYAGYIFVGIIAVFLLAVFLGKKLLHRLESRHLEDDGAESDADVKD
ncbi:DedA family protein [Microbacterium sp. W4I20]|uniref:DedA family protein n=1 Tax=Microbacterium sp. W4I20 TaxID=3042262 RepID=UPI0027D83088|nr:DedA family protein [Microbacterium sp. W4I20]